MYMYVYILFLYIHIIVVLALKNSHQSTVKVTAFYDLWWLSFLVTKLLGQISR